MIERAKSLGGLDTRLLENKRFVEVYLRPMVSDFRHLFEYRYKDYGRTSHCDTTFFYSESDTKKKDVGQWEKLIDGSYEYYEMGSNHFFINQYYDEMAEVINEKLIRCR